MAGDTDTVGAPLPMDWTAIPVVLLPDYDRGAIGLAIGSINSKPGVVMYGGETPADGGYPTLTPMFLTSPAAARKLAEKLVAMADEIERVTGVRR